MTESTCDTGKWGEEIAARYLESKSYQILYRNWRAGKGDIDIIARDHQDLVFVEVKGGSSHHFGPPELRLTPAKKRQLYKLALLFLEQNQTLSPDMCRFDVVIIDRSQTRYEIRHYQNAFTR